MDDVTIVSQSSGVVSRSGLYALFVSVTELASTPLGKDFDKDNEAPFGIVP